ncbi:MAG TPA: hypothetical protein VLX68_02630 [Chitinivibrionales bacterium]|nr:hypothetical protein [Chitinivibrionales bacterium]
MAKKSKKMVHKQSKKAVTKGSRFTCRECGLQLSVINECDCASPCDVVCCGEPMIMTC